MLFGWTLSFLESRTGSDERSMCSKQTASAHGALFVLNVCLKRKSEASVHSLVQIPEVGDEEKDISILHYGAVDAHNR